MSEINLSAAVRSNLNTLQQTADLLSTTQERLATGNRVNSALDDPTAFFTAAALNDRAADLSTLLDEQGQAIQTIEAADNGITAITDLVESARAIANQALQTNNLESRASFAAQYDALLDQIETLAQDASFNGTNLLAGQDLQVVFNETSTSSLTVTGVDFTGAETGLGLADQAAGFIPATPATTASTNLDVAGLSAGDTLAVTVANGSTANVTLTDTDATNGTLDQAFDPANIGAGDQLTIGSTTVTFGDGSGGTIDTAGITDLASLATALDGTDGVTVEVNGTNDGLALTSATGDPTFAFTDAGEDGTLSQAFTASDVTNGDTITIDDGTGSAVTLTFGTGPGEIDASGGFADNAALASAINASFPNVGVTATGAGPLELTSANGNPTFAFADNDGSAGITTQTGTGFAAAGANDIATQTGTGFSAGDGIDAAELEAQLTAAGVTGLTVAANGATGVTLTSDTGDITVNDGSTDIASSAAGGADDTAFSAGAPATFGTGFSTNTSINLTLEAIDSALSTLRNTATTLGTNVSVIQIRQDFTADLINTLEVGAGNLTLADLNEEGANLLTLQTRQQLASTSLSFATQADQAVLSLFG